MQGFLAVLKGHLLSPVKVALLVLCFTGVGSVASTCTTVDDDQIVLKDCDGAITVWRRPGVHQIGLCERRKYPARTVVSFGERVQMNVPAVVRGSLQILMPEDDEQMILLDRVYGDTFVMRHVLPAAMADVQSGLDAFRAYQRAEGWFPPVSGEIRGYGPPDMTSMGFERLESCTRSFVADLIQQRLDTDYFSFGVSTTVTIDSIDAAPRDLP